jgi:hypothetical protein
MLTDAGLTDVRVGVGARKSGDPFTVLIAAGTKPQAAASPARAARPEPPPSRPSRTARNE